MGGLNILVYNSGNSDFSLIAQLWFFTGERHPNFFLTQNNFILLFYFLHLFKSTLDSSSNGF